MCTLRNNNIFYINDYIMGHVKGSSWRYRGFERVISSGIKLKNAFEGKEGNVILLGPQVVLLASPPW